ncbi:MAG: rhodanese-like domain-containing protein [Pseudomonadota bacterium]
MNILSRRVALIGFVGAIPLGFVAYSTANPTLDETLTPTSAFAALQSGDIVLVDIRRPDEWKLTGIAQGAVAIDMRRDDFINAVLAARQSNSQPIALICARGVRSARTARLLTDAGLTPIIDIPEGMLGSFAGPGWLKQGLPVREWSENN